MSNRTITSHELVTLSGLLPHPNNPRQGDVDGLVKSIEKFGQVRPLVVQLSSGIIVAGNHTAEAIRRVHGPDAQVEIVRVDLSDEDAAAYALADNKLSDNAGYDDEQLLRVLNDLNEKGALDGTGFDQDDVDDLLVAIGAIEPPPTQDFTGGYAEPEEATAERWAGREEGKSREVVFLLLEEDFERFNELVGDLQKEWGLSSKAETIKQAVEYAHRSDKLNKMPTNKPPEPFGQPEPIREQRMTITPIVEGSGFPLTENGND